MMVGDSIYETIYQAYPKLQGIGGITFLKGKKNGGNKLFKIPLPAQGDFTARYLKDTVNFGRLFIKPLQKDIKVEKIKVIKNNWLQNYKYVYYDNVCFSLI